MKKRRFAFGSCRWFCKLNCLFSLTALTCELKSSLTETSFLISYYWQFELSCVVCINTFFCSKWCLELSNVCMLCNRYCFRSVLCWRIRTPTTLLSQRSPTCIRPTELSTKPQLVAGRKSMPWVKAPMLPSHLPSP